MMTLRQAIYQRMQEKHTDGLFETIDSAMDHDERTLPGLGVLFEIIWKNSDRQTRTQLVQTIHEHLPRQSFSSKTN
jgi:small acid-soluble spore protein I (minor)